MDNSSKLIGQNGGLFIDSSATNQDIYSIYVCSDAVFTVLKEADKKGDTGTDAISPMNLSGKTIPAGTIITPYKNIFTDVTVSSGSVFAYKLGR